MWLSFLFLFIFVFLPQRKPHSSLLYSAVRLVLGYFAPKFQQYEGLGYALYLKTERETGTTFILVGAEKKFCLVLQTMIFSKSEPRQCLYPGLGRGSPRARRSFASPGTRRCAFSGLCSHPGCSGDGTIHIRKLTTRIKPQTITSSGTRRFPTKLPSSRCGH